MSIWHIYGGNRLTGSTQVQGAKNAVLPIMAASVLAGSETVLHNVPDLRDVTTTLRILQHLGCTAVRDGDTVRIDSRGMNRDFIPHDLMRELRSSVIFLGAILTRFGTASLSMPGGCELGPRPVNLHLDALRALGAEVTERGGDIVCCAHDLKGRRILLPFPSVGATENAILAALRCPGETVLKNAAKEPEITDLVNFLRSAGAEIFGAGTSELHIRGDQPLHGTTYSIQPDRIETATFLCAAAGCGGEVLLRRTDARMLQSVTALLRQTGCELLEEQDAVLVRKTGKTGIISDVKTAAYPGFPTDCQAILTAALLRAEGESRIEETVFEDRFHHVPELRKLGAKLEIHHNTVHISGVRTLSGAKLTARDLRGGAALVLAAMQASSGYPVAMLPQPYVTTAQMQMEGLKVALDMTEEWDKVSPDSALVTGVVVARKEFVEQNEAAFNEFLEDYKASTEFVNANVDEAAALVAGYEIVPKEPIAQKALPECNITFISGADMKAKVSGYLKVLYDQNPEAVGGTLPDDAFYYGA